MELPPKTTNNIFFSKTSFFQSEFVYSGSILKSKGMDAIFLKKQNIWKYRQKCRKFENILQKGRWLRAIIACNKLLE